MQLDLYTTATAPEETGQRQPLSRFLTQRKVFITIDDATEYKRCRVQSNRKGVVLRDLAKGAAINTKKQQLCRPGDFLVAEIDAKVGGYGFVPAELDKAIVSSHYYLFEVDEAQLLPRYLYYLTQSGIIQSQISSQGSTNYAAIRPKEFLAIEIPYVELDTQREVVARLDALTLESEDFGREAAHQATLLTRLRQAILREAVQGRLLPQDPTDEPAPALLARIRAEKQRLVQQKKLRADKLLPPLSDTEVPYVLPQGWLWCRLGEVCRIINGRAYKKEELLDAGTPVLRVGNLFTSTKWYYSDLSLEEDKYCDKGDLIYAWSASFGPRIWEGPRAIYHYHIWKLDYASVIDRDFLFHLLQNETAAIKAESKGVAMLHMTKESMDKKIIPLPPLPEQRRIVAKVTELLSHFAALEAEGQRARQAAEALHAAALREAFQPVPVRVAIN